MPSFFLFSCTCVCSGTFTSWGTFTWSVKTTQRRRTHCCSTLVYSRWGKQSHARIWRHISLLNAGPGVLFFLITCHNWDSFALADKRRWPPNDEAPSLVYGIASSTAATSLWWLMLCTCPVCVCVWGCACMSLRLFDLLCRFNSFIRHMNLSISCSSSPLCVSLHQSSWTLFNNFYNLHLSAGSVLSFRSHYWKQQAGTHSML